MLMYLAARYSRFPEMQTYAKDLERLGHTVTSRWIHGDHELRAAGHAESDRVAALWAFEDYEDLLAATCCLSFTEPPAPIEGRARGGRHVEFGLALAHQKRCVVVGYRENVFHWLAAVEFYPSWEDCMATLGQEK
jgi:hypothetical protein